jgi:hypothetical protein|tara:strand:- start:382 stop:717 length:336 start_codon:yes stop_codon:yes gene_type:complete
MNEEHIEILTELEEKDTSSPERILFLSVIFQALLDATKEKTIVESSDVSIERARAAAWFFCSVGVTCDNFEYVCESAGMDAEFTRSFALKVINSKEIKYVRQRIKRVLDKS